MNSFTLVVYDGRQCIGDLEDRGRATVVTYRRLGPNRRIKIGVFESRQLAMRALVRSDDVASRKPRE